MPHTCALCGNVTFKNFNDYRAHRIEWHGHTEPKDVIKPVKTSKRTKEEIVYEWEFMNRKGIIS